MKQAQSLKEAMIQGKSKLFERDDFDPIVTGLLIQYVDNLTAYLDNP